MVSEAGVLLDQDTSSAETSDILDASFVEHFFHVYVDNEISKGTLCKFVPEKERSTVFANGTLDCGRIEEARQVGRLSVTDVSGLYDSDVIITDLDDDC